LFFAYDLIWQYQLYANKRKSADPSGYFMYSPRIDHEGPEEE